MLVEYIAGFEDGPVPWFGILDLWMAMGGNSADFDAWIAELHNGQPRSRADAWSTLLAIVRGSPDIADDHNPPPGRLALELRERFHERNR